MFINANYFYAKSRGPFSPSNRYYLSVSPRLSERLFFRKGSLIRWRCATLRLHAINSLPIFSCERNRLVRYKVCALIKASTRSRLIFRDTHKQSALIIGIIIHLTVIITINLNLISIKLKFNTCYFPRKELAGNNLMKKIKFSFFLRIFLCNMGFPKYN